MNLKKITAVLFLVLIPLAIQANFIGMNRGVRPMAMGGAYVGLADDPTAVFWNPAGLARVDYYSIIASHQNLFGVNDLYNEMAAISIPLPKLRLGVGWTQINLLHEYSEQIIAFSGASVIWINKMPIYFGTTIKNFSANVSGYSGASEPTTDLLGIELAGKWDTDLGLLVSPKKNISLGFSLRNLFQREFEFISDADKIERELTFGICYNWRSVANFLLDYQKTGDDENWYAGGEIWFFDVFAPRIGMKGEHLTIGFGLDTKNWNFSSAVLAHKELGSTYRIALEIKFK